MSAVEQQMLMQAPCIHAVPFSERADRVSWSFGDASYRSGIVLLCRFPATAKKSDADFYCKFNDKTLQTYSAIMHFTGALASLPAGYITQRFGRTTSMIIAGSAYILGSILQVHFKLS